MRRTMPNLFAYAVLLSWPLIALVLYAVLPVGRATIWTILGAQLLLPVGASIKFDMIPALDKASLASLAALAGYIIARKPPALHKPVGLFEVLVFVYITSPFVTAVFNQDWITSPARVLPPSGYYDALSASVSQIIFLIPLFLGRALLNSSRDTIQLLRIFTLCMTLYTLPLLFEVRMSPQLHFWIYGNSPSDFIQSMRDGGFRPMVFMGHGLPTAFYLMMGVVAGAALWKIGSKREQKVFGGEAILLGGVLVLAKSLASIIYTSVLVPLVLFFTPKVQLRIAQLFVAIALLYPISRSIDVFPARLITSAAGLVSEERAASINFRFVNEEELLSRAGERWFFGWGRFGRSRIYDPDTGKDLSVTDGRWIITLGQFGFVGFLAEFGLFALIIFKAASAVSFSRSTEDGVVLGALALLFSVTIVNLLPNAALFPWTLLMAGALIGRSERIILSKRYPRISRPEALLAEVKQ